MEALARLRGDLQKLEEVYILFSSEKKKKIKIHLIPFLDSINYMIKSLNMWIIILYLSKGNRTAYDSSIYSCTSLQEYIDYTIKATCYVFCSLTHSVFLSLYIQLKPIKCMLITQEMA